MTAGVWGESLRRGAQGTEVPFLSPPFSSLGPHPQTLPADHQLTRALAGLLPPDALWPSSGEFLLEALPSSRPVFRFTPPSGKSPVVGKFLFTYPPSSSPDRSLVREYQNYLGAPALGLGDGSRATPRLLGRCPEMGLGLLLEAIPGPDLDHLLLRACRHGEQDPLYRGLEKLAGLLTFFHTRPLAEDPVSPYPALKYLDKLRSQLQGRGLLSSEDEESLKEERLAWEARLPKFFDRRVLVHGDATPTNFLFPDGRVVALDLERLGSGDRLWDLSWVAGELKHAWGWRTGDPGLAEPCIRHFFSAYLWALSADSGLEERIHRLNPFYMALAELRIARNDYLSWDYRRGLIAEARRCLYYGRRM